MRRIGIIPKRGRLILGWGIALSLLLSWGRAGLADSYDEATYHRRQAELKIEEAGTGEAELEEDVEKIPPLVAEGRKTNVATIEKDVEAIANTPNPTPRQREQIRRYNEERERQRIEQAIRKMPRVNWKADSEYMKKLYQMSRAGDRGGGYFDTATLPAGGAAIPAPAPDRILKGTFRRPPASAPVPVYAGGLTSRETYENNEKYLNWAARGNSRIANELGQIRPEIRRYKRIVKSEPPLPTVNPLRKIQNEINRIESELRREQQSLSSHKRNADYHYRKYKEKRARAYAIADKSKRLQADWDKNVKPYYNTQNLGSAVQGFQSRNREANVRSWKETKGRTTWTYYEYWGIGGKTFQAINNEIDSVWRSSKEDYRLYQDYRRRKRRSESKIAELKRKNTWKKNELAALKRKMSKQADKWRQVFQALVRILARIHKLRQEHDVIMKTTIQLVKEMKKHVDAK
jgi:hypothetical protein